MYIMMKHLAIIQSEFLKEARKWDDLSLEEQKAYLKRHPKSRRKITAKPERSSKALADVKSRLTSKKKELGQKAQPAKPVKLSKKVKDDLNQATYSMISETIQDKEEDWRDDLADEVQTFLSHTESHIKDLELAKTDATKEPIDSMIKSIQAISKINENEKIGPLSRRDVRTLAEEADAFSEHYNSVFSR
jgi:hypothetical protein